jgi:hypothetical protein
MYYVIGKTVPNGDILVDWKRQKRRGEQPRYVLKAKLLLENLPGVSPLKHTTESYRKFRFYL